MKPSTLELLSTESVGVYLVRRGLVGRAEPLEAVELAGGVSNVVLAARSWKRRLVVKQALPRLRVPEEWHAKRERAISEARALQLTAGLSPGAVPPVLDVDDEACALVLAEAPAAWQDWKSLLLAGKTDPRVAECLGEILAIWHRETWNNTGVARSFNDIEAFNQLRVDPYYRTVMLRHPHLASFVQAYVDRMLADRRCLVHGDYSPKNVLVGPQGVWIVDFEVVHYGDPAFDLAFMLNHLMLKALHRPMLRDGYAHCARAFWDSYVNGMPTSCAPDPMHALGQVGCLMLARVDGKSRAEYLREREREVARALGSRLLAHPPNSLTEAWGLLEETLVT